MRRLRLALAQMNSIVGDLDRNAATIRRLIGEARRAGADLVAFPEMALPGYPPEDLLLKPQFIRDNLQALDAIAPATRGLAAIVGVVDRNGDIFNAAAVLADGRRVGMYHKMYLPNYGVFDEDRYFQAGRRCAVFRVAGVTVGVNICEDIWYPEGRRSSRRSRRGRGHREHQRPPHYQGKGRSASGCTRRARPTTS
jgi:NAD+ synthase (glutamine-hydrolysing)